jgi:hypothetical protein
VKLIICPDCGSKKIGPKSERWPSGGPVLMSRWIGGSTHDVVFKCHHCTSAFKLSAVAFNGLPEMTPAQVKELAPSAQDAVD